MAASDIFEYNDKAYNKYCRVGESDTNYTITNMCLAIQNIYFNTRRSIVPVLLFLKNLKTDFGSLNILASYYYGYAFVLNSSFIGTGSIFCAMILHTYESSGKSIQSNVYWGSKEDFSDARATWRYES